METTNQYLLALLIFGFCMFLFMHLACNNESAATMKSNNDFLYALETQLGGRFKIDSVKFVRRQGLSVVNAHLESNPKLTFSAKINPETNEVISTDYVRRVWSSELKLDIEKLINEYTSEYALNVNVYSNLAYETDPKKVPSFYEIVNDIDDLETNQFAYFFIDTITENELILIQNIAKLVKKQNPKQAHFQYSFYSKETISGRSVSDFQFGFTNLRINSFERKFEKNLNSQLVFALKANSELPTLRQLESSINHDPSIFGSQTIHF